MAVDENGDWIPFTKKENPTYKEHSKDVSHRRFNVTLQPVQLYESMKKSLHNDELDYERMLTLFRVLADALHRSNDESNVLMWKHIKARTEVWYLNQRRKTNKKV